MFLLRHRSSSRQSCVNWVSIGPYRITGSSNNEEIPRAWNRSNWHLPIQIMCDIAYLCGVISKRGLRGDIWSSCSGSYCLRWHGMHGLTGLCSVFLFCQYSQVLFLLFCPCNHFVYIRMYVCMHVCMCVCVYVCMYVCMSVCMYARMYVEYVCVCL